jgi:6-phosphogluconolactonase/glucosamine-6-phosphate isomerase/deaminase
MKTLIERVLRVWWMTALCVVLLALSGCSTQYVPVETVKTETERVVDIQRDSIYVLDSIYVREAHDTIYITKWRTEYKEALRIDTLNIERIDTLNTIVEVEKKLTKVQQLKMDVGAGVLYAVPILIAVGLFILYRKLKK